MTPRQQQAASSSSRRVLAPVIVLAAILFAGSISARIVSAQQTRCADCHFADPNAPNPSHISDWERSPHGQRQVACERCHDGDPTTFEKTLAHRGILSPAQARSPVNRVNLPATCGACHAGPFSQFQRSRHFELLKMGNRNGPTCSTCHGEVAGNLPSPRAIEGRCQGCHGERTSQPRPGRAAQARSMIEGLRDVRAQLREAERALGQVADQERRTRLGADAQQVRAAIVQAADAGHAFVYDGLQERLGLARTRLAALQTQIVNPPAAR